MVDVADTWIIALRKGELGAAELDSETAGAWQRLMSSDAGRDRIAKVLGVTPDELSDGLESPLKVKPEHGAGLDASTLVVIGLWIGTEIILPTLIDLTKEQLKRRLQDLWRRVIVPEIRAHKKSHAAVDEERGMD